MWIVKYSNIWKLFDEELLNARKINNFLSYILDNNTYYFPCDQDIFIWYTFLHFLEIAFVRKTSPKSQTVFGSYRHIGVKMNTHTMKWCISSLTASVYNSAVSDLAVNVQHNGSTGAIREARATQIVLKSVSTHLGSMTCWQCHT